MTAIVLVLANLMDRDGTLNAETAARVDHGIAVFRDSDADYLMLIGWDYRPDSDLPISRAMLKYCETSSDIDGNRILLNSASRDTVGDAILSRAQLEPQFGAVALTVVTTDYHVERCEAIFRHVYGPDRGVRVVGAPSSVGNDRTAAEQDSLAAFQRSFAGVAPGDLPAMLDRLVTAHPFYNGKAFPDRPFHVGDGAPSA